MPTLNETIQSDRKQVNSLNADFTRGVVFVDNTFQRRSVWVQKNRVRLIETMLKGFPMPEIYLWASKPDPQTGATTFSIVDGQQRLTTIRDFIANSFALTSQYLDEGVDTYQDRNFNQLSDELKRSIWEYHVTARTIPSHVNREQIVAMFLRLNETDKSLNPQELRNAEFNGEFVSNVERIADLDFWNDHNIFRAAQVRRMGDLQFVSSLLIFIRSGVEAEVTQAAINRMYDSYNDNYPERESDFATIVAILSKIDILFRASEKAKKFFRSGVHLYPLFVAVFHGAKNNRVFNAEHWVSSLDKFVDAYNSEVPPEGVAKYRLAATEGTQKRANRAERINRLIEWLE
jgi:Protein of unknown function DUF262